MRTTFAVGRMTSGAAEIVLLEDEGRPSFPGPWTLRAVVRERETAASGTASSGSGSRERRPPADVGRHPDPGTETVH